MFLIRNLRIPRWVYYTRWNQSQTAKFEEIMRSWISIILKWILRLCPFSARSATLQPRKDLNKRLKQDSIFITGLDVCMNTEYLRKNSFCSLGSDKWGPWAVFHVYVLCVTLEREMRKQWCFEWPNPARILFMRGLCIRSLVISNRTHM